MNEIVKSNLVDGGISNQTPIEIMLQVDEKGETTARKLYEFLELDKRNFARWSKSNITENMFAVENSDFVRLVIDEETPTGGKIQREDYKLTAAFAKKLCMTSKSERGEQARNYFIKVEEKLKKDSLVTNGSTVFLAQQIQNIANLMGNYMQLNMAEMQKMKDDTKKEVQDIVRDSIIIKDEQIEHTMDMIGLRDKNTKSLTIVLKDKLSDLAGREITATSPIYKKAKEKVFKNFRVVRWEDIPIGKYSSVYAFIDGLDSSEFSFIYH